MSDARTPDPDAGNRPDSPSDESGWTGRRGSLIPADTIVGRALVTVIAIMTFLASLTAGSALLVREASRDWSSLVAREMTIQVKPQLGREIEADLKRAASIARTAPGVASVRVFTRKQSAALLEPWLGTGLELDELPVPRLIVVEIAAGAADTGTELAKRLSEALPNAVVDNHRLWLDRLGTMSGALVAIALVIFGLVLTAMILAVMFATRGAMAGSRDIIDVLHFVGAEDSFIAWEFQKHFLVLGLKGGLLGGTLAVITFLAAGLLAREWFAGTSGEQVQALFGTFSLGLAGYLTIAVIAFGIAIITGIVSKTIVFRYLRS